MTRRSAPSTFRLSKSVPVALVNLSYRTVGFYVASGNPKEITGWDDLRRADLSILNRAPGSSPRILLDGQLRAMGIDARHVRGYEIEMQNHLTMAAAVAGGEADLAVGTERVSRQIDGIDFIPLMTERLDLAVRREVLETPAGEALLQALRSRDFRTEIRHVSGNDCRDLGRIVWEG